MTNQQHPITPPPELRAQWREEAPLYNGGYVQREDWFIDRAAQWGADQELEACCEWLQDPDLNVDTYKLRVARRPKPPSLKNKALADLEQLLDIAKASGVFNPPDTIRRALEALPND